jgi:hypothetical protein
MEFTTKINITKSPFEITHEDDVLLCGSCFTENIGKYLNDFQFKTLINPFGIMYNPVSIFNSLDRIVHKKLYTEDDLLLHHQLYVSLDHHGDFSATHKLEVLNHINSNIEQAYSFYKASKYLIITLGTSLVYKHIEQNKVVANCYKIPNTAFHKIFLSVDEIVKDFNKMAAFLQDKKIVFTVSPIRHWRDGAVENQRSKSILIESIHQIMEQNNNCFYFPAYEIMMDELRDYRFYAEDMIHPNTVAVKYIWQKFSETYFSEHTSKINKRIEKINLLLQHKIKHQNTKEQFLFEEKIKNTIQEFKRDFPNVVVNF